MIKINKRKVKQNKLPIAMLFAELITAILAVYLFYRLLGFKFSFESRTISISPTLDPMLLFLFVIAVVLLADIYFVIKRRFSGLFKAQESAKGTIKDKAKEKLSKAANDPKTAALLLIEFIFIMAIAITIVAWADPTFELIPWGRIGIAAPLTTILNGIVALIALAFFYYLYSFTAWYRK